MIQNNKIWRIGLTGGIASGKSTVSTYLKEKNEYIIDADIISREIVEPNSPILLKLQTQFGYDILLENGTLDRKKLGEIVFQNPEELEKLNAIMFPAIWDRINQMIEMYMLKESNATRLFIDAAILLESGGIDYVDEVWLVVCDQKQQLERLMLRDGFSQTQAKQRLAAQWPLEKKREFANIILDNSSSKEDLLVQIDQSLEKLNRRRNVERRI